MKKNNFKITPQVYKELEKAASELPKFQRKNTNGTLMTRSASIRIKGSDIATDKRKDIVGFQESNYYIQHVHEPVLVNHSIGLRTVYQQDGEVGVKAYINYFVKLNQQQSLEMLNAKIEEPCLDIKEN